MLLVLLVILYGKWGKMHLVVTSLPAGLGSWPSVSDPDSNEPAINTYGFLLGFHLKILKTITRALIILI